MKSKPVEIDTIRIDDLDGLAVHFYCPDNQYEALMSLADRYREAAKEKKEVHATFEVTFKHGRETESKQEIKVIPVEIGEGIAYTEIIG